MNTTELKALAEKATPGLWSHEEIDPTDPGWGACEILTAADDCVATHVCSVKDAAYIAAANPAAILELITAHEDAQGEIRALRVTEQNLRDRLAQVEADHEALKKAISAAEPVAWYGPAADGRSVAYFDGRPMLMVGSVGNSMHTVPLYTLEGIRKD